MQENLGDLDLMAFSNPMDVTRIQQGVTISFPQGNSSLPPIGGIPGSISVLFSMVATVVIGGGIAIAVGIIHNSIYPVVARESRVAAKRRNFRKNSPHPDHTNPDHLPHAYYVTFEFVNGEQQEFSISGKDYDRLLEDDQGILHSQGSWFRGFER